MIKISLDNDIVNKNDDWLAMFDGENHVFSLDFLKQAIEKYPEDKEITIDIHSRGGQVSEALASYDYLRNSGLNIHTNIVGDCHSAATILLLAAPKENRTANANCSSIIHKVRGGTNQQYNTAEELEDAAESIRQDTNKILTIYADRTNKTREELEAIMKEEKSRTAEELLSWGFISKINIPNTNKIDNNKNQNQNNMGKLKESVLKKTDEFLASMNKLFASNVNFEFLDESGAVLFTTEKATDDDTLAVGDVASPDGTFTLSGETSEYPAGTVVVITGGVIESITDSSSTANNEEMAAENAALKAENEALKANLQQSVNVITSLKGEIETNHVPAGRATITPTKEPKKETVNLDDVRANLKSNKSKK